MAVWSELSEDVLGLILGRLPFTDSIRSGSVCKRWNSIIADNNHKQRSSPWLMLPGPGDDKMTAKFFSLADQRIHKIRLPPPAIDRRICIGSSFGWLITVDEALNFHLLNPLTGVQIPLPSITTLPFFETVLDYRGRIKKLVYIDKYGREEIKYKPELRCHFFDKAILTSAPSGGDFTVVLMHLPCRKLAVTTAGATAWTPVRSDRDYDDIISHDGRIHTVTMNGLVESWDLDRPEFPSSFRHSILSWDLDTRLKGYSKYQVESLSGELFMVLRRQGRAIDGRVQNKTAHFIVLVQNKETRVWSPVTDMKDNVIFVGISLSMVLSAKEFPELRRNCIYFTDGNLHYSCLDRHCSRDMGVCDMVEKKMLPIGSLGKNLEWPPPIWVTPTLF